MPGHRRNCDCPQPLWAYLIPLTNGQGAALKVPPMLNTLFLTALALLFGFALYVRLAPSDPARWHVEPPSPTSDPGTVLALRGAATLHIAGDGPALLRRLAVIAAATPRTRVIAGSVDEGRITWVTRSRLWAFPDYTTAEARADGLHLHARLRFGGEDHGVNAARLKDWQSRL
jgi:hypothetical protein